MKGPRILNSVFLFLFLLSSGLPAATWYVNGSAAGTETGMSAGDAFTNLQDGLAAALAGDVVLVAEGEYFPDVGGGAADNDRNATFQLITGVEVRGGYPAEGGARDVSQHLTILSGDIDGDDTVGPVGENSYSVVTGSGTDATAILDGVTIIRGLANAGNEDAFDGPTRAGAALFSSGGSPTIRNCRIIRNSAGFGGGAFNINSSAPSFVNCLLAGNKATFFGGGMNNRDSSSPVLVNCTLTSNSADSFSGGGAITNFSASNPSLTNCIIWNNEANGDRTTAQSSVNDGGSSSTSYAKCLVANLNPGGTNLDGTSAASDPGFLIPGEPSAAPDLSGNFRLEEGSPALDIGDNAANSETKDVIGNPRVRDGIIDLGAYEGGFPAVLLDVLHVDQMVASAGDGSDWTQAFATLNDALATAVSGQTIRVAKGTYYPDEGSGASDGDRSANYQLKGGVIIIGGYPSGGGPRDLGLNPTILSGDIDQNDSGSPVGNNSHTVVTGLNQGPSAVLDGFIIEAGLANAGAGGFDDPQNAGGAMLIKQGSPTILNCILRGNFALSGGAVFVTGNSTPTFVNCVVSGNVTTSFGGGFHNRQGSNPIFINSTFSGNTASSAGGAMNNFGGNPSFTNCIVWNNMAGGVTTSEAASIRDSGSSASTFEYCLVQNQALTGTNLNDTDAGNDPLFVLPIEPSASPSTSGDLRLSVGSTSLDAGDMLANSQVVDVTGGPRVIGGGIDLGAYEGAIEIPDSDGDGLSDSFEMAHTTPPSSTSLVADSNGDKDSFTALEEFAYGLDPNVSNGDSDVYSITITEDAMMNYLSISWTINPAAIPFVNILAEQSFDLGENDTWSNSDTVSISAPTGMGAARSSSAISSPGKDFLRVRVEKK